MEDKIFVQDLPRKVITELKVEYLDSIYVQTYGRNLTDFEVVKIDELISDDSIFEIYKNQVWDKSILED